MGSIILNNLRKTVNKDVKSRYIDLHLDIQENKLPTTLTSDKIQGKDIKVDYDVDAIMNSLVNIFNTNIGDRFLIPNFGINLRKYLFMQITEPVANRIGNEILRAIEDWEPRVTVEYINVVGYPDRYEYGIDIVVTIDELKETVKFNGILNQDKDITLRNLNRVCRT